MTKTYCKLTTPINQAKIIPFPLAHNPNSTIGRNFDPIDKPRDPVFKIATEMASFCAHQMFKLGIKTKSFLDFSEELEELVVDFSRGAK